MTMHFNPPPLHPPFVSRAPRPSSASGAAFALAIALLSTWQPSVRAASASEANWPQWRGPLASGAAPVATPPVRWSETNNVRWKVKVPGAGLSTPIVWGNQVFLQTAIPTGKKAEAAAEAPKPSEGDGPRGPGGPPRGQKPTEFHRFVLLCLDRQTGQTLWEKTVREEVPHEGAHQADGTFASHSPITDGERVYAYFGSRGLHCFDLKGDLKWSQQFGQMRVKNSFGEGSSPALHGDVLVVNWDHEGDSFITALDKRSGKELWRVPRDEKTSWATPLIVEHAGKPQAVVSASGKVRSYDLKTGQVLWECGGMTANAIPSPVTEDGMVYVMSGFRGAALLAIKLGGAGDLSTGDSIVWRAQKATPYVPSPLLYGGRLYFFSNNNGVLSCFEAKSGKALLDSERIEALSGVYASPLGAAGRVYLVGRNGATVVLKQSDQLEVLATNQLDDKFDASPAAVGKDLFLRGRANLYCLSEL